MLSLSVYCQQSKTNNSMKVTQFLFFDGTCKQAMEFYQTCLGGELVAIPVANTPMAAAFPPSMHQRIINARLISANLDFSACDWMLPEEKFTRGNMNCMYITDGSREETKRIFAALSKNGIITDPITDQPFGLYGALNDQFGVRWMFHAE